MSQSEQQNYQNHRKVTPAFYVLALISLTALIMSITYIVMEKFSYLSILLLAITVCVTLLTLMVRKNATKLQDRIIRQEENFRHFVLTGQPMDSRLNLKQIIALRFVEDAAFPALSVKAVENDMEPIAIKKSITHWRADHLRV